MRVYLVVVLGRQHLGDYIFQRADSAWWTKDEADGRLRELRKELLENGKQKLVHITTDYGEADCICEAGAFEFEMPPPPKETT